MTDIPESPGVDIDAIHRNPRYAQKKEIAHMDTATAATPDTEDRVRKSVTMLLGHQPEAVTRDKKFVDDLGADSLDRVELVMAVEDEFGIEIPDDDAEPLHTFGQLCDYVESRTTKPVAG